MLVAYEVVELHAHGVVVEVAGKVENIALNAHAVAAGDGRANAHIRDGHVLFAVIQEHLRGVDAVAWDKHSLGEAHIYSRRTELAAELEAVMHGVHEAVRVAEQPVGLLHVAIGDQLTYARRAHDVAVELSADGQVHIQYFESSEEFYDISVSGGVLTMTGATDKSWTDYIGLAPSAEYRKIVLQVPDAMLENLTIAKIRNC